MTRFALILIATLAAGAAQAACYADYKAKRDNPLQLHYGVAEIAGPCTEANAAAQLPPRLATDGWELLSIVSLFDEAALPEKEENAADFFLRY
ncbi:MAG: hypothetical protein ACU0CI_04030 [Shimia sp.]